MSASCFRRIVRASAATVVVGAIVAFAGACQSGGGGGGGGGGAGNAGGGGTNDSCAALTSRYQQSTQALQQATQNGQTPTTEALCENLDIGIALIDGGCYTGTDSATMRDTFVQNQQTFGCS